MTDFTRRSFLKGVGAVSVGLLFSKRLERVLGELEAESFSEAPVVVGQAPAAAVITCTPQGFRPSRLIIPAAVTSRKMTVPVTKFIPCAACGGSGFSAIDLEDPDRDYDDCAACGGTGGKRVETGELEERDVATSPWIIEDIVIGKRSQFTGEGGVPGDMFGPAVLDNFMALDAAPSGTEIQFRVRYVGDKPEGERFRAALIGSCLDGGRARQAILPIDSTVNIVRAGEA